MKHAKRTAKILGRMILTILILSLALTGCGQEEADEIVIDEYPSWYYGSIFDPQSPEAGEPLASYRFTWDKVPKGDSVLGGALIYTDALIDELIKYDSPFKVTEILYDIKGDLPPVRKETRILTDMGSERETRGNSITHSFGIDMDLLCDSGVYSICIELDRLDAEDSTCYLHLYYVQYDDTVYFFDNFEEFYKCMIRVGYV